MRKIGNWCPKYGKSSWGGAWMYIPFYSVTIIITGSTCFLSIAKINCRCLLIKSSLLLHQSSIHHAMHVPSFTSLLPLTLKQYNCYSLSIFQFIYLLVLLINKRILFLIQQVNKLGGGRGLLPGIAFQRKQSPTYSWVAEQSYES